MPISEVLPGEVGDEGSLANIGEKLESSSEISIFALCCATRVAKVVDLLDLPEMATAITSGISLGWSWFTTESESIDLDPAVLRVESVVPVALEQGGHVDNATVAVLYALRALRDKDRSSALNSAKRVRNLSYDLAREIWPTMSLEFLVESPVFVAEFRRQLADAKEIAGWGGVVTHERVARLRMRAERDGDEFVKVVRGDDIASRSGKEAPEQSSLF
ncbi:hypothetical protein [Paractinoplanes hotanensis]|uniref:Uncharacterized protein n=1 Tax=Paractinoplanes hotanensis TaxID=2906497 RepID=A0ABT0YGK7_9ACTN|nr:hypothetical protein [Actinoplanes hotanensis]MCM4085212.1 hypothetical protein [Actinoplanes hotanensis]